MGLAPPWLKPVVQDPQQTLLLDLPFLRHNRSSTEHIPPSFCNKAMEVCMDPKAVLV